MKNEKLTGSGIICYYDNRNKKIKTLQSDIVFLFLKDFQGKYDVTKGSIDKHKNEDSFSCAIRETYEESNLETVDFVKIEKQPININQTLELYLGELKEETVLNIKDIVKLNINPYINSPEHASYTLTTLKNVENNLLSYLKPYLQEAVKILL